MVTKPVITGFSLIYFSCLAMKPKESKVTYRWLILIASALSQVLTFGLSYSVGVFYKDWITYFDSSASFLSLVSSAPTAIACILGKKVVRMLLVTTQNEQSCYDHRRLIAKVVQTLQLKNCFFADLRYRG